MNIISTVNWNIRPGRLEAYLDSYATTLRPRKPDLVFRAIVQPRLGQEYLAEMNFRTREEYEHQMRRWLGDSKFEYYCGGGALPADYLPRLKAEKVIIEVDPTDPPFPGAGPVRMLHPVPDPNAITRKNLWEGNLFDLDPDGQKP